MYFSKAKAMKWNLYPGLKIWKELLVARKTQSPTHVGVKMFMKMKTMADKYPQNVAQAVKKNKIK